MAKQENELENGAGASAARGADAKTQTAPAEAGGARTARSGASAPMATKASSDQVEHPVAEEEKPSTGVFARAQSSGVNTPQLAQRLQARKDDLKRRESDLAPSRPVSLEHLSRFFNQPRQERDMPRYQSGPDRD